MEIVIKRFMTEDLKLKNNELLLYALIYSSSQDGRSAVESSLQYLADTLNISTFSLKNVRNKLIEKKLIEKEIFYLGNVQNCRYFINREMISGIKEDVSRTSFIILQTEFIKEFKGNELYFYSWVYSFCKLNMTVEKCYSEVKEIAEFFNFHEKVGYRILDRLVEKGYLKKNKQTRKVRNTYTTKMSFSICIEKCPLRQPKLQEKAVSGTCPFGGACRKAESSVEVIKQQAREQRLEEARNAVEADFAKKKLHNDEQQDKQKTQVECVETAEKLSLDEQAVNASELRFDVKAKMLEFLEHRKNLGRQLFYKQIANFIAKLVSFSSVPAEQIQILQKAMFGNYVDIVPLAKAEKATKTIAQKTKYNAHNRSYSDEQLEALIDDDIDNIQI